MASNIVVSMTNFCNNRCKFCYMSKFLIDKIEENIDYDKFYNNTIYLLKKVNDKVSLRVYGGELFADEFSDDHINSVYNYIDKVKKFSEENNIDIEITVGTNLLYNKIDRIIEQCKTHKDVTLKISYDFKYRFNKETLELFKRNYDKIKEYVSDISLVANKSNYQEIQKESRYKEIFNEMYNDNKKIHLINYIANEDEYEKELLSTEEYFEFYKYMFINYPNVIQINDIVKNIKNGTKTKCMICSGYGLKPNGDITTCCLYQYNENRYINKNVSLENRNVLAANKFSCFSCPYYNNLCITPCPLSVVTSNFGNDCYVRKFIDWVKDKV